MTPAPLRRRARCAGSRSASRASSRTTPSTSRPRAARCTRSSARTAPARARSRTSSPASTGRTRARSRSTARTAVFHSPSDAIDAGIGMVHQHFRLVPPFTVAENVVLGEHREEARRFFLQPRHDRGARRRARRALRPRGRPARADLAALGRRAAAGRDPEGALPRGADPDPRRADRGADAAGVGGALRDAADDGRRGPDGDLHLAQAARGEGGRRPGDRAARRPDGRDRRDRRGDARASSPR